MEKHRAILFFLLIVISLSVVFYPIPRSSKAPVLVSDSNYKTVFISGVSYKFSERTGSVSFERLESGIMNYNLSMCDFKSIYIDVYNSQVSSGYLSVSMFVFKNNGEIKNIVIRKVEADYITKYVTDVLLSKPVC